MLFVALDLAILHREIVVGIDGAFLRHQVAHVAIGREHLEVLAQVLLDGLRLGGRFDDDEVVCHALLGCYRAAGRAPRINGSPIPARRRSLKLSSGVRRIAELVPTCQITN